MADFSKMKTSELIRFAEEQAEIEGKTIDPSALTQDASWADTAEILRTMKERGVPEAFQD